MSKPEKSIVTVSTQGRVTIPKMLRIKHRWLPGSKVTIEETREGVLLRLAAARKAKALKVRAL